MAWPTLMEPVTSGRSAVRRISASVLRSMISFMQAVPAATMPIPASAQSSLMVSTGRPDLCWPKKKPHQAVTTTSVVTRILVSCA